MTGRRVRPAPARGPAARPLPAPHWWLLAAVLALVLVALVVDSAASTVGPSGTAADGRPAVAAPGGTVLARQGDAVVARQMPPRTVALTFEDGPDPRWTPQVLDLLAARGARATFVVTGGRVAQHPGLVRQILAGGHDVVNHGWSHTGTSTLPPWRQRLELSLTQVALAGATGQVAALHRPPYTAGPATLTQDGDTAVAAALDAGYGVVLADVDPRDWQDSTAAELVVAAAPAADGSGAVVLLHDGGGDRSATVEALPALLEEYTAAGYRVTTVSAALRLDGAANPPVGTARSVQGAVLLGAVRVSGAVVPVLAAAVLVLGVLAGLRTVLVVLLARRHVRVSARRVAGDPWLPPVSVLVPAFNEAVGIAGAVRSLVASDHPELEIVVVDDGSTDGTGDVVEALALPGVRVVRQPNAGKAAALRTGAALATHDVMVMLDGDTVFEPDTVRLLVQPLRDPRVGAVSGNTKVGNRRGLLGRWQHLEYVSGFNLDRRLLDLLRCITTVPGACGAFRREALEAAGGLSTDTLAEDTDLTMAILRAGYEVVHEERARAWTEAPSTVRDLWRQRYRWSYGTLQCLWKHRHAVVERGPGRRLGRVGLPYMVLFQVVLPVVAPVIDVVALHAVLSGNALPVAAVWLGFAVVQLATGAYALRLDGESLRPLWSLPLQQLFYRQMIYLVVIQSIAAAVAGARLPWHKLHRSGDVVVPA